MRLIDADELIKGRVENDPVRIAVMCAPTAYDVEEILREHLKEISERDTAMPIETVSSGSPVCPVCGRHAIKCYTYCPGCGQRLEQ